MNCEFIWPLVNPNLTGSDVQKRLWCRTKADLFHTQTSIHVNKTFKWPPDIIRPVGRIWPPTETDETIPQTNINPGSDPAACQEDELEREKKQKKLHSSSRKPGKGEGGGFWEVWWVITFSFLPALPHFWHCNAELEYLHGRLPRHAFNGPLLSLDKLLTLNVNCQSHSCLHGCHHHKLSLLILHFETGGDNKSRLTAWTKKKKKIRRNVQWLEPLLAQIYRLSLRFVLVSAQVLKELLRLNTAGDMSQWISATMLRIYYLLTSSCVTITCWRMLVKRWQRSNRGALYSTFFS